MGRRRGRKPFLSTWRSAEADSNSAQKAFQT
jgi:hypothetical protein